GMPDECGEALDRRARLCLRTRDDLPKQGNERVAGGRDDITMMKCREHFRFAAPASERRVEQQSGEALVVTREQRGHEHLGKRWPCQTLLDVVPLDASPGAVVLGIERAGLGTGVKLLELDRRPRVPHQDALLRALG